MTDLHRYITEHRLIQIGTSTLAEIILDDPADFCRTVPTLSARIRNVTWWEYTEIGKQAASLGAGGPRDPRDPRCMWAEVYHISRKFAPDADAETILAYIAAVRAEHPGHDLRPAFDVEYTETEK